MKNADLKFVNLIGGSFYVTHNPQDAFRVLEGCVYVYIVPWINKKPARRVLFYEAVEGEVIPSFAYTDMDYSSWRFCFVAEKEARLEVMEGVVTIPLKEKFVMKAGITNYKQEGYENSIVDRYRMNLVKEVGYLMRQSQENRDILCKTDNLIASVFNEKENPTEKTGNSLYNVVSALCKEVNIDIAPLENIKEACGDKFNIFDIARISHFCCREIRLEDNWNNMDAGAMVIFDEQSKVPAACVPKGQHKYEIIYDTNKKKKLKNNKIKQMGSKGYAISRAFPRKSMTVRDLFQFCLRGINKRDLFMVFALTILTSAIGLFIPILNQQMYDNFIPMGYKNVIVQMGLIAVAFILGNVAFSIVKNIAKFRLESRISYSVQHAAYQRLFELPWHFFEKYDSADLGQNIVELGLLTGKTILLIISVIIAFVSFMIYMGRMILYSMPMATVSMAMISTYAVMVYITAMYRLKYQRDITQKEGILSGVIYQFLTSIEKIRISGVENRAIYEYMKPFVEQRKSDTKMNRLENYSHTLTGAAKGIFLMLIIIMAYNSDALSMGRFVGFVSAFGLALEMADGIISSVVDIKMIYPELEEIKPVLETAPENSGDKLMPKDIEGNIVMEHVSFSYTDEDKVISDLSLEIKSGEYVGIIGASGSGKTTLLKLLLGLEHNDSGKIYFDNQDMDKLNTQELRKKFGVVLQDGGLIAGSILENLTLAVSDVSMPVVKTAIEAAGLTEDIEKMPMGLYTLLSEDGGNISAGQKQRILIARAILNNPQILFLDEATSALDNITQEIICNTIESMKCTRVVFAHRLNTIKNCHKIIVLKDGTIAEEGDYKSLMERKGLFYDFACRQIN